VNSPARHPLPRAESIFVLGRVLLLILSATVPPGVSLRAADSAPVPLRDARQVLGLSAEELKAEHPVQLRLVVAHVDAQYGLLFGVDATAGLYLSGMGKTFDGKPGALLEITGFARPGLFAPFVEVRDWHGAGEQPLPPPRAVGVGEVLSGCLDSQWVEVTGIIHAERLSRGRLQLDMVSGLNRLRIAVLESTNYEALKLTDSLVRARGVVSSSLDPAGRVTGFKLLVSGLPDLAVLERPAVDAAASRPLPILDLKSYEGRRHAPHRIRVQGVVTLFAPGRALFLQDSSGGLMVQTRSEDELKAGDQAEVVGFLGPSAEPLRLEDAIVQKVGTTNPPAPVRVSVEQALAGQHDHLLVDLEAGLLHHFRSDSNLVFLVLKNGARILTASLSSPGSSDPLPGLEDGSRLLLTGVCQRQPLAANTEPGLHFWLRSPTDVRVLSRPAQAASFYWQREIVVAALVAVALLAGLAAANWRQRRRTERLLVEQSALQAQVRQSEEQLLRSMQERERMGQDLHDDLIQSIYAVGLGLEDTRRHLRQVPEQAESRLAAAIQSLNEIIRNVRSFIAGLEPKILNGREFKTALKSLALTTGDSQTQFAIEVDAAAANLLTPTEATQLLHIAKEAMSNSLRHARASRITVSLQPAGHGVRLEIRDDGVGFDADRAAPSGQGLHNMGARAAALDARMEVISAPGAGCRVLLDLPKGNSDDRH